MIGQTVSHYKLLEKLGEGGMGVVYKAQDLKLDRFVALKFLPPHISADEEEKKRFTREARATSALEHTNICNVHEIDETEDGRMFIAMAYYEGETPKKKIERGPLKLVEALNLFFERDINLTRVESRPTRRQLGTYIFLIDMEGHRTEPPLAAALTALDGLAEWLRVLGSYPCWRGTHATEG